MDASSFTTRKLRGVALVTVSLAILAILSACSGTGESGPAAGAANPGSPVSMSNCAHPHPCGNEWPKGLEGPFERDRTEHVQVTSHDGTILDGWLSFPKLPAGVKAPTVLITSPYLATVMHHPTFGPFVLRHPQSELLVGGSYADAGKVDSWWGDTELQFDKNLNGLGLFPIQWIRAGFVLANFSVRGTGHSGGCFDAGGPAEQADQTALVDWLAAQPWSNGRVGAGGISYIGATTWQAATQAPRALKAIAALAPIIDLYEYVFTPQGALQSAVFAIVPGLWTGYTNPPVLGELAMIGEASAGRSTCSVPLTAEILAGFAGSGRSREFYEARDLKPKLGKVTAAVLQVQGYADAGHTFQDRELTASLPAGTPVRELRGWWPHEHPGVGMPVAFSPTLEQDWASIVIPWFDYWLKGVGEKPRLAVDHADQTWAWHVSKEWPPREVREIELPVDGSFRSVPRPDTSFASWALGADVPGGTSLCLPSDGVQPLSVQALLAPETDLVIAGNPHIEATLSSDGPAGIVAATLYELTPDFACDGNGMPTGAKFLAHGALDLQFFETRYVAQDFPLDTPVSVRIDLLDTTAVIRAGNRLALVLSRGDQFEQIGAHTHYPMITVHPGSRLVLPLFSGSLGGLQR